MPAPTRILAILAKLQAGAGVDAAPDATNAVRALGIPTVKPKYLEDGSRADEQHGGLGSLGTTGRVGRYVELGLKIALKGGGADYSIAANRPECDAFLQAAGLTVTASGAAGAGKLVYADADATDTFPLITVYAYSQYKLYKIIDGVVLPKISYESGKRAVLDLTVVGRLVTDPTDAAMPNGLTWNATVPPVFAGAQNSIGAFTQASATPLLTRKADIDFGTAYAAQIGGGAPDGLAGFIITDRNVKQNVTIQSVPLASLAIHQIARQATQGAGIVDASSKYVIGAAGVFNRVTLELGQWGPEPAEGDAQGLGTTVLDGPIAARSLAAGTGAPGRCVALTFD